MHQWPLSKELMSTNQQCTSNYNNIHSEPEKRATLF